MSKSKAFVLIAYTKHGESSVVGVALDENNANELKSQCEDHEKKRPVLPEDWELFNPRKKELLLKKWHDRNMAWCKAHPGGENASLHELFLIENVRLIDDKTG